MSLQKNVGIKVTSKSDQAAGDLERLAAKADKAGNAIAGMGRQGDGMKKLGKVIRGTATEITSSFGLAADALRTIDAVIMGQARYQALLRNVPFSIKQATDATKGYIAETKMLEAAQAANRSGFIKDGTTFAKYAENVQKLAMASGKDTTEAMDVLTRALAKQESELLDNYDIILKVEDARKILGDQLAKEGRAMTEYERQNAFGIIGMQKIAEVAAKANVELDAHTAAWMQLRATLTDFPALMSKVSDAIADGLSAADAWEQRVYRDINGEVEGMGDHRRGVGLKGGFGKLRKAVMADVMAPDLSALENWKEAEYQRGYALGNLTLDQMNSGLEAAAKDRIFGKKGGKKHRFAWAAALQNELRMAEAEAFMQRAGSDTRAEAKAFGSLAMDQSLKEAGERAAKEAAEIELKRSEAVLEARQMALEIAGERGLSPEKVAEAEAQALQTQLDAKERYIQATMTGAERLMAVEALQGERRRVEHTREMARIQAELKAKKKEEETREKIGTSIIDIHTGIAAAAIQGAFAEGQSVKAAVAGFAKARAIEMTILASTESIKAIAAAASFNFVAAEGHGMAAGLAAAEAGVLFGIAGATGAFGGGGGSGRGSGGGGGYGGGRGGSRPSTPSNGGIAPISRLPSGPIAPPVSGSIGGGHASTIVVNNNSVLPMDTEQQMLQLRRMLAQSERDNPRA